MNSYTVYSTDHDIHNLLDLARIFDEKGKDVFIAYQLPYTQFLSKRLGRIFIVSRPLGSEQQSQKL